MTEQLAKMDPDTAAGLKTVVSENYALRSRVRELEQALREIGKHTMESEDDIDFIIDACHAALRGAQP